MRRVEWTMSLLALKRGWIERNARVAIVKQLEPRRELPAAQLAAYLVKQGLIGPSQGRWLRQATQRVREHASAICGDAGETLTDPDHCIARRGLEAGLIDRDSVIHVLIKQEVHGPSESFAALLLPLLEPRKGATTSVRIADASVDAPLEADALPHGALEDLDDLEAMISEPGETDTPGAQQAATVFAGVPAGDPLAIPASVRGDLQEEEQDTDALARTLAARGHATKRVHVGRRVLDVGAELIARSPAEYSDAVEIARGGMGAILRAVHTATNRQVALKLITKTSPSTFEVQKFINEAQITAQLQHPGVIPVYDLSMTREGQLFYAMKLVRGQTLGEIVELVKKAPKAWPLTRLLRLLLRACEPMAYAHAQGVIHRDLKPENIMVGEFGEVLVMDWGLAKASGDGNIDVCRGQFDKEQTEHTSLGTVLGSPAYMAPEQAGGEIDRIDHRSDIYAIGATLYELLTLEPPFGGDGKPLMTVLSEIVFADFRPPRERAPERQIPAALEAVVLKAMAKEPDDRYRSVEALMDDLKAWLDQNDPRRGGGESRGPARRPARESRVAAPGASAPAPLAAIAVIAVGLLLILAVGLIRGIGGPAPAAQPPTPTSPPQVARTRAQLAAGQLDRLIAEVQPELLGGDRALQRKLLSRLSTAIRRLETAYELEPADDLRAALGRALVTQAKLAVAAEASYLAQAAGRRMIELDWQRAEADALLARARGLSDAGPDSPQAAALAAVRAEVADGKALALVEEADRMFEGEPRVKERRALIARLVGLCRRLELAVAAGDKPIAALLARASLATARLALDARSPMLALHAARRAQALGLADSATTVVLKQAQSALDLAEERE